MPSRHGCWNTLARFSMPVHEDQMDIRHGSVSKGEASGSCCWASESVSCTSCHPKGPTATPMATWEAAGWKASSLDTAAPRTPIPWPPSTAWPTCGRSTGGPPRIAGTLRESLALRPRRGPPGRSRKSEWSLPTRMPSLLRPGDAHRLRCRRRFASTTPTWRNMGSRVSANNASTTSSIVSLRQASATRPHVGRGSWMP